MKNSDIINTLLFDYSTLTEVDFNHLLSLLPKKLIRYMAEVHPDNKTRKLFFSATNVSIGKDTVINKHMMVSDDYLPLLKIGDRVAIGPNVTIICASGPNNSRLGMLPLVKDNLIVSKEVTINDDAWLGANVVVLPGVVVGESTVIGAGSVVTKSTEPFSVYAGSPAKFIKSLL
jgi:acetyltransferase-like isoleucine patch superfamily enzyme